MLFKNVLNKENIKKASIFTTTSEAQINPIPTRRDSALEDRKIIGRKSIVSSDRKKPLITNGWFTRDNNKSKSIFEEDMDTGNADENELKNWFSKRKNLNLKSKENFYKNLKDNKETFQFLFFYFFYFAF